MEYLEAIEGLDLRSRHTVEEAADILFGRLLDILLSEPDSNADLAIRKAYESCQDDTTPSDLLHPDECLKLIEHVYGLGAASAQVRSCHPMPAAPDQVRSWLVREAATAIWQLARLLTRGLLAIVQRRLNLLGKTFLDLRRPEPESMLVPARRPQVPSEVPISFRGYLSGEPGEEALVLESVHALTVGRQQLWITLGTSEPIADVPTVGPSEPESMTFPVILAPCG